MIYARLDTTTDPPHLDWGHAVYPSKGKTIEELEYREFPDLAAARAFYGMPADADSTSSTSTPPASNEP